MYILIKIYRIYWLGLILKVTKSKFGVYISGKGNKLHSIELFSYPHDVCFLMVQKHCSLLLFLKSITDYIFFKFGKRLYSAYQGYLNRKAHCCNVNWYEYLYVTYNERATHLHSSGTRLTPCLSHMTQRIVIEDYSVKFIFWEVWVNRWKTEVNAFIDTSEWLTCY